MRIEDWIERLDSKLESVEGNILEIKINQARQQVSLDEHMRRTQLAEDNITLLRSEVKPISTHVAFFGVMSKILGLLGVLVGIAAGLYEVFK